MGLLSYDRISFSNLLISSFLLRLLFISIGSLIDSSNLVDLNYTDIDYYVLSDAALFVKRGLSPYLRFSFRYPPFFSFLLLGFDFSLFFFFFHIPKNWRYDPYIIYIIFISLINSFLGDHILFPNVGKVIFSLIDLMIGWIMYQLLLSKTNNNIKLSKFVSTIGWLFNPYSIIISTRGSSDSIIILILLSLIWCLEMFSRSIKQLHSPPSLLSTNIIQCGIFFGLSVYIRIFPIIFFPLIVHFIISSTVNKQQQEVLENENHPSLFQLIKHEFHSIQQTSNPLGLSSLVQSIMKSNTVKSLVLFVGSFLMFYFVVCLGSSYLWFGFESIDQSLLFHITTRKDHRHNFSPWFYPIYLQLYHQKDGDLESCEGGLGMEYHDQDSLIENQTCSNSFDPFSSILMGNDQILSIIAQFLPILVISIFPPHFPSSPRYNNKNSSASSSSIDLISSLFLISFYFVTFNKVITAQYFLWYLSFVPFLIIFHYEKTSLRSLITLGGVWLAGIGNWLFSAYLLEFHPSWIVAHNLNPYLIVWISSCIFLILHTIVLVGFMKLVYS